MGFQKMKLISASSLATVAWSACNNIGNNGANSGFHVKTDWPAGDATGFEGLITVPISGGTLCNWTIQVTFNTGVYDFHFGVKMLIWSLKTAKSGISPPNQILVNLV